MRLMLLATFLLLASPVAAYIGPGAGIGLLGSLLAWVVGIFLALAAILFWPLRLLWRRMRAKKADAASTPNAPE